MPEDCDDVEFNRRIGRRFRLVRLQQHISPPEVAAAVGISAELLHLYESGDAMIPATRLTDLAKTLHMPVEFFVHEQPLLDWFGHWKLLLEIRSLDPPTQEKIQRFVTDLAGDVTIS